MVKEKTLLTYSDKEKSILQFAKENQLIIGKKELKILSKKNEWKKILKKLVEKGFFLITEKEIEKEVLKTKTLVEEPTIKIHEKQKKIEAKENPANFRIIKEYDVTGKSYSEGKIENFLEYFKNKFFSLRKMFENRFPSKIKEIQRIKKITNKTEFYLVGMVNTKWVTKKNHLAIKLEDENGSCTGVILENDLKGIKEKILLDDVIAVKAIKLGNDFILIKEVHWPDIPNRKPKTITKDIRIAQISDMHIGSKLFLEKQFFKFLDWINLKIGFEKEILEIGKIKYIVVTGDNVDGIGIYPQQYNELAIKEIDKQYELFEEYILQIPEYIEVFIIPGQHDAVRWAEPQPAIPKKLVPELSKAKNVHLMGSPSWVEIEGIKTLLYHGPSIHELFSSIPGLSYAKPSQAVIETLKRRTLATTYGLKQPYVPEKKDYLIIRDIPDLVFMGDLHHADYNNYRGTTIINGSTWQDRTEYQIKLGHVPTPAIVSQVSLKDRNIKETKFK